MMEGSGEREQQTTGTDKKLHCKHDFSFAVVQPFYSIFNGRCYERTKAKTNRPDSLLFQHYLGANLMKVAAKASVVGL